MYFASDNAGPALPEIMQAVYDANEGYAFGYGSDEVTAGAVALVREVFEAPDAAVYFVTSGTAANALALSCFVAPYETVLCTPWAHIHRSECAAPEFYSGAKLTLVGEDDKMQPDELAAAIHLCKSRGFQGVQPAALSISQVTEFGQVYSIDELKALTEVARANGMATHLDGARFANAMVSLDVSAAEMSWKAGIDAVSFGGTKNGCMGVEAVVLFDPDKAQQFEARRKRGGHLLSKHRFLSAQMQAYLKDDLWIKTAQSANGTCAHLVNGLRSIPDVQLAYPPQANLIFCEISEAAQARLREAGASFYVRGEDDDKGLVRLVVDWSLPVSEADRFLDILRG